MVHGLRSSSGSLAKFAAMRRASSTLDHASMTTVRVDVAVLLMRRIFGLRFRGHNGLAILTHQGPQLRKPALLPN